MSKKGEKHIIGQKRIFKIFLHKQKIGILNNEVHMNVFLDREGKTVTFN